MFGFRRRSARPAPEPPCPDVREVRIDRSLPLPTAGVPTQADVIAEVDRYADRLLAAGALDEFIGDFLDPLLDARLRDARVALRSEIDERAAVDDRLVDEARVAWIAAQHRHAAVLDEIARDELGLDELERRLRGERARAPEVAARRLSAVPEAG